MPGKCKAAPAATSALYLYTLPGCRRLLQLQLTCATRPGALSRADPSRAGAGARGASTLQPLHCAAESEYYSMHAYITLFEKK